MNVLLLLVLAQDVTGRGTNLGEYNVRQQFETGYRFATIDGNRGKYRSDVNYLNGIRLLNSSLSVNSRNNKGKYFDEILLNTVGLGNDPYQFTSLRVEKVRKYRYEMNWRLNEYVNPGLTIAYGQHLQNLERRMQDHQLTLFPAKWLQFYGGYSGNVQDGPALSTANVFDSRGNIFPFFENVRRRQDEYRIGGLVQVAGFKFFWQRGWEFFKEDTRGLLSGPGTPLDPTVTTTTIDLLRRDHPYHGSTPHWRVNLFGEQSRWYTVNARFTHSGGSRNFIFDEVANGVARGVARNVQTLVYGDARRPVTTANLSFSILPTERITISNHTSFHNSKMEGDNTLRQLTNSSLDFTLANFQFLGIRAVTNSTIVDVALRKWISLQGGYQFSDRRIRSVENVEESGFSDPIRAEQSNRLHAATAGFRFRPVKGLTIVADGEVGRQNQPFFTTSDKDYHAFGARAEYRQKTFRLATQVRTNVNFNSASLFRHSSRSRNYTLDAAWTPATRFALEGGYQRLHLDTATGVSYFLNFQQVLGQSSIFASNVHAVHAGTRVGITRKLDVFTGLAATKDTAESLGLFVQAFPLTFVSPQVRVGYRVNDKLRLNGNYQYYEYSERLQALQNYRAHTGYLSVLWSF